MRLDKPIGTLLLLWPTLWALWLAGNGKPNKNIVIIFILGVIIMRSAGCIINDIADRHVDKFVERTRQRPLATQEISVHSAIILFSLLCIFAFLLVIQLNMLTIGLAFIGLLLTIIYPFMKRFTHLPQIGLGFAFAWGVPMAFAAELQAVPISAWALFFVAALWPIIYDTIYAMVDRADDMKIGVKSTAILFGRQTPLIIAILQLIWIISLIGVGLLFSLQWPYFISVGLASALFIYQLWLIYEADRLNCFKAFLNNQWIGMIIFLGVLLSESI